MAAAGLSLQCNNASDGTGSGDSDGGPAPGDPSGTDDQGDLTPPSPCHGRTAFIRIANAQTLDPIIEDPSRCLLYGIDQAGDAVYYIDTQADVVSHVVALGAQATDLTLSADRSYLYVSVLGDKAIKVLDALDGSLVKAVPVDPAPYRLARGPGFTAYYVKEDIFSAVYAVNLDTGAEVVSTAIEFHEPDLEATADGQRLFLGEANLPGSKLVRFDTMPDLVQQDSYVFDGGFTLPSPQRRIYLAESSDRIYFADRAFLADHLTKMRGWLGDQVLAASPDGSVLATRELLFDGLTFVSFAARPHAGTGVLFSADSKWIYEFSATGSLLYRTAVSTLLGVHHLGETVVPPGSLAQHDFSQILADPIRPVIYGLDTQQNQIVVIDRPSRMPTRAEIIGSSPTDMAIVGSGDEMVVALFGATQLAVLDLTNGTKIYKRPIDVPGNPFRVATSILGRIAYAEQDQYSDVALIDYASGAMLAALPNTVFQPDVEFDPTGHYLFAGESAGPSAKLRRYDVDLDTFAEAGVTTDSYAYPTRKVIFFGGYLYYAGRKLDATTLAEVGNFTEDIVLVTPDGRYAVSRRRIFDANTFAQVGGLPVDSGLITADPVDPILYQFDNETGALFVKSLPSP